MCADERHLSKTNAEGEKKMIVYCETQEIYYAANPLGEKVLDLPQGMFSTATGITEDVVFTQKGDYRGLTSKGCVFEAEWRMETAVQEALDLLGRRDLSAPFNLCYFYEGEAREARQMWTRAKLDLPSHLVTWIEPVRSARIAKVERYGIQR